MSLNFRTKLATILRRVAQGLLTKEEAYHEICEMYLKAESWD